MSDELPENLRPIADFFALPGIAVIAKDFYVVRAIRAQVMLDAAPFTLVFGGGTALARAHRLIRRMSEDVDFKIVPLPSSAPVSRSALRRQLERLRKRVSAGLQAAGFAFDLADKSVAWARDEGQYASLATALYGGRRGRGGAAPRNQVELNYAPLRRPTVALPVSSFVAEALGRPPEVPEVACVSIVETAAEKLVSLTHRTAMEMAGASRDPDPTLVRHIYDLHMMRDLVEPAVIAALARSIAEADAQQFASQYPAYAADIAGETHKAMTALLSNPSHRRRYDDFVSAMVYGERMEFGEAMASQIDSFANRFFSSSILSRERLMQRFKWPRLAQSFLSAHSFIYGLFRQRRHRMTAGSYRAERAKAFGVWQQETCDQQAA